MQHVQSLAYWRQHRFLSVVTIPGNIYGPYDNFDLEQAHVVPALVRKFVEAADWRHERLVVWGSGTPTRAFVYAGDVAEGILRAAEVYERPEIVNLAAGRETGIAEVVHALADITAFAGQIVWDSTRPDGQSRRLFDVSKAAGDLGWHARTSLRDGLAKTVAWYRANRATARNVA
jgi:nucleoside-diphosphate-sugar epimerase